MELVNHHRVMTSVNLFSFCALLLFLTLTFCLCLSLSGISAWAQEKPKHQDFRELSITQEALNRAEAEFLKGLTAYQAKKYSKAAQSFQSAYQLVPYRDLLFNIARAHEEKGNQREAIKYYKLYINTEPVDETLIIRRIRELGEPNFRVSKKSKKNKRKVEINPAPLTEKNQLLPQSALTWGALGGGAVLIAVGSYFGLEALKGAADARNAREPGLYDSSREAAESNALIADISIALGVTAVAGGIYLWMTEPDHSSHTSTSPHVEMSVNPLSRTFGISGSF